MENVKMSDEERAYARKVKDKKAGIYNRFKIKESEIDLAVKHIIGKYGMDELEALTHLFTLAFDKKIELDLDKELFERREFCEYYIKNIKNI